jgi:hypothetical protein
MPRHDEPTRVRTSHNARIIFVEIQKLADYFPQATISQSHDVAVGARIMVREDDFAAWLDSCAVTRVRRKRGLRVIFFEARDVEVAALVRNGWLAPAARDSRNEIATAFGAMLDELPPDRWPVRG